jgi:hypothetical protein
MANFHPNTELLRKNISGSIDGDAIQNDITGAIGTPPNKRELITGMTPQEQKGLNAPIVVARKIDSKGFLPKACSMYLEAPDKFTMTASGIVMSR